MYVYLLASLIYLLLGLGIIALMVALLPLPGSKRLVSSSGAKIFIALCRSVAVFVGLFLVPLQPSEPFLVWAVRLTSIAFLAWEVTGIFADRQAKVAQAEFSTLKDNLRQIRTLLTTLREVIASKRSAIGLGLRRERVEASDRLSQIRAALDPPRRLRELLASFASLLVVESQSAGRAEAQSFRVCLYVERGGFMEEESSWDTARQDVAGTQSWARPELRGRFDLENTDDPSVIVRAVQEQQMIVVSNCGKEERVRRKARKVFYFTGAQKNYLKSLVCYPFDISHDPKKSRWAVLAVDTDVADHFPVKPSGFLRSSLVEYSKRIDLELVYKELLDLPADHGRRSPS